MPQHIVVTEYNPLWKEMFEKEAEKIKNILKENLIEIHHIGSTSVPGMAAKSIIDIMPVVRSINDVDNLKNEFENIGYEYLGEFGIKGRRYLRKGGDERTHQIHIFSFSNKHDINRHLALKYYLISHSKDAAVYSQLKRELSLKFPYSIDDYCNGKDSFVKELEERALLWQKSLKI